MSADEIQEQIRKYFLNKLDTYTYKSYLSQLLHAPNIRRNLLKKAHQLSKTHSISEDLVRQCMTQLLSDVDHYVEQLYQLISSPQFDGLIAAFNHSDKINNGWYKMQLERARQLFPTIADSDQQFNDNEVLENYYKYVQNKFTPNKDALYADAMAKRRENLFDLNTAYLQAEAKAKEFLKNFITKTRKRQTPNLKLIDEMIKLGVKHMKQIPSKDDFQQIDSLLDRITIFRRTKEAYQYVLKSTGDDFMILRFGRILGHNALPNTSQFNKQFVYLLHLFLKSAFMFFSLLIDNTNNVIISSMPEISSLFFADDDSSIIKLNFDLFSPESNIDEWTWLLEQWRDVLRTMPLTLTRSGSFSRLVRTTIGIGLMHLGQCAETIVNTGHLTMDITVMNEQLFHALQIGFYFGIAYAVVDCFQDEIHDIDGTSLRNFLAFNSEKNSTSSVSETVDRWLSIMEELLSGHDFDRNELPKTPVTTMVIDTFDNLLTLTQFNNSTCGSFNELALLLRSQRIDQKTADAQYDDEQLYLGAILKSHFTYTCAAHLGNMMTACEESDRLWYIPFLGQLTDDCRDFNNDVKSSSVTPYTYYANLVKRTKGNRINSLLNPFYVFLNLCTDIYLSSGRDAQTGAFLGRRIARTLRSVEITKDQAAYRQFLDIFCADNSLLYDYCWNKLRRQFPSIADPEKEFFRTLDAFGVQFSQTNRKLETYVAENLPVIEDALLIDPIISSRLPMRDENILISAMNYSVKAGGKRFRMLLLLMVADLYGIDTKKILPLACGMEYLHTSSLILDDLPAQDNSDLRRGRPTLHKTTIDGDIPETLCEGRAQLAAVSLIAVSMTLTTDTLARNGFSAESISRTVDEISQLMHSLCIGQMMDLRAARVGITECIGQVDQLDRIAWLKTGKTIEAVLVTPVILSDRPLPVQNTDITRLRELARLMGILFQMRDDLLDIEESHSIGKPTALDVKNNNVTYVSVLGVDGTRHRLQQYLAQTLQLVDECWPTNAETIKDVVRHIVSRKH